MRSADTDRGAGRQRLALLLAALLALSGSVVSVALGESAGNQACDAVNATRPGTCDNQITPQANRSTDWTAIGGAQYGDKGALVPQSETPYTVDFSTVAFERGNDNHGFAGGAACDPTTSWNDLDTCTRYPVIWEYSVTDTGTHWREVYRGTSPGYVAALAFKTDGTALAVGGDATPSADCKSCGYPRREPTEPTDPTTDLKYVGHGLAWTYDGSAWTPLPDPGKSAGTDPPTMHGLDAVDCSPRPADGDFCVAGGYGQLWMWHNGRFDKVFTPTNGGPADWRFRVRDVRFTPGTLNGDTPDVVAVTSGCCDTVPANDSARLLYYKNDSWKSHQLGDVGDLTANARDLPHSLPESYYSAVTTPTRIGMSPEVTVVASAGGPPDHYPASSEPASRLLWNDLNNSRSSTELEPLGAGQNGGTGGFDNSGSAVGGNVDLTGGLTNQLLNPNFSDVRLVSGDGDFAGTPVPGPYQYLQSPRNSGGPDGLMDWAVGELDTTGQAVAYTTLQGESYAPNPLDCPSGVRLSDPTNPSSLSGNTDATKCTPRADDTDQTKSHRLFALDTYALNAFRFTQDGSFGWAVGDRGAIERLGGGGGGQAGAEPAPPALGAHQVGAASDTHEYDAYRAVGAPPQPGTVPPLASQPFEPIVSPRFAPGGSPDPSRPANARFEGISSMVMSGDGSEGWAVGPGTTPSSTDMTLYHYIGGRWIRCGAPEGAGGSDPACASLGQVMAYRDGPNAVVLNAVARVPTENGSDPSTADDFEAVAVGTAYQAPGDSVKRPLLLRYRDGKWSVDDIAMKQVDKDGGATIPLTDVAFTSPDDGWIAGGDSAAVLYHYDGTEWHKCGAPAETGKGDEACGDDPTGLLPLGVNYGQLHLATAGKRIYLGGAKPAAGEAGGTKSPVILYKDPGGSWTATSVGGGGGTQTAGDNEVVTDLSVARNSDGTYSGWATTCCVGSGGNGPSTVLQLSSSKNEWTPWPGHDAASDYLTDHEPDKQFPPQGAIVTLPGSGGDGEALAVIMGNSRNFFGSRAPVHPLVRYDPESKRWRAASTPFQLSGRAGDVQVQATEAAVEAMAPDGEGGYWIAVRRVVVAEPDAQERNPGYSEYFYHYTSHVRKPVFEDVPQPIREPITGMTGGADGSVWVTTTSSNVYRYDRITGWDRIGIPGWDPGKVVTRASDANAVAVGPDGKGVIVGKQGRIANVETGKGVLDAVAGTAAGHCPSSGGCGTSRDLRAAAVASDGSAMVGGDDHALLWRGPHGDEFHGITTPTVPPSATFNGVAFSDPQHVWLTTDGGQLFAGQLSGGDWQWRLEDVDGAGKLLTDNGAGGATPLRAIAMNGSGAGYAVGDRGVILERDPAGGAHPWRRLNEGFLDNLESVALPPGGGPGALIGGDLGLVLTLQDGRFEVARPADFYDPLVTGQGDALAAKTVGVAALPGNKPGQVEAWAALQVPQNILTFRSPSPGAILHYTNAPDDPLLDAGLHRAEPLPDTPAPQHGEVAFAAFGKSECNNTSAPCPEPVASNLSNDVISSRIVDAIAARAHELPGATVSVFTGDVDEVSGKNDADRLQTVSGTVGADTPTDESRIHNRWRELVADRLLGAGVPLFGAIGEQDLSQAQACIGGNCVSSRKNTGAGLSLPWRQAFAGMPAPWGSTDAQAPNQGSWSFHTAPDSESGTPAPDGGARTHYAVDVEHDGQSVVRLVVVDSALKTVTGAGSVGNPVEEQTTWLDKVLSNRPNNERAVVVSETPSYSDGPGATSDTLVDQAPFETQMFTNKVSAVISGRLGWNALYYMCAPALHDPGPNGNGSPYPAQTSKVCDATGSTTGSTGAPQPPPQVQQVAQQIAPLLPPAAQPLVASQQTGLTPIPSVIAASAGGKFGPNGNSSGSANDGFWHGYTLVRVEPDGAVNIEQRPVFDWIGIRAQNNTLGPGQHVTLKGFGREPMGMDQPARYDDINSPAVTHLYSLVQADPHRPWLPRVDESLKGPADPPGYVPLDPSVGSIDQQSGAVSAGRGNHEKVYAVGLLSVGDRVASWPLVFEPRKSFRPPAPLVITPPPAQLPPLHVAAAGATALPAAPPPPPPQVGTPPLPQLPALPSLPPLASAPPPAPPPPPPAPPPPSFGQPLPLSLSPQPTPVSVLGTVVPPSPPPVNPAPPSGSAAKKEARQRQAAAAKSEEGAAESPDPSEAQGGQNGGERQNMTMRRPDRDSGTHAFSARAPAAQPSAWARDALAGGGLIVMALVLALGWTVVRPTPRRREPTIPAPAWARNRRPGRR